MNHWRKHFGIYLPSRGALELPHARREFGPATIGAVAGSRRRTSGASPITAKTAVFDGANDYMTRGATPTGLADGKAFTFSFWVKMGASTDGNLYTITGSTASSKITIDRTAGNLINVIGQNPSVVTRLNVSSGNQLTEASGWVHVYGCFDMAGGSATGKRKIYFNGVQETLTETTFTDDTLDIANGNWRIGAQSGPANRLKGSLAEYWFDDTYFDDPTKFASGGHPISLGSNGELPTGTAPAMYYSLVGGGNDWDQDSSGNGNHMTITGSLTEDTSP